MNKFWKNNITIRKGFIISVILLIVLNILFISGYYKLFFSRLVLNRYEDFIVELEEKVDNVIDSLVEIDEPSPYLKKFSEDNNLSIMIYNDKNELIREYGNNNKKYNLTISRIVNYKEQSYLINIVQKRNAITFKMALDFIIFELVNVFSLASLGIIVSDIKLLGPITDLSKDINNYKLGIIPKKRKKKGEITSIQNDFVDLVYDLENEKQNQNRIIASISHDIKTPLTSILGYSERIITNDLTEEMKEKYNKTIYNKSLSLKDIVEEFDDYLSCNIKNNQKLEKISIKYIVEYLKQYYKEDLKEKGIELKVKTNCLNAVILVDLAKFKRIFSNVITNSIRHYDKKKKLLNVYINEQKDDTIVFEIADNGCGCKEDLEKIFEPLYTTDKSRKICGLGLSICKEIVLSHNGTIKAMNNKMGGFSIIFTIQEYKED